MAKVKKQDVMIYSARDWAFMVEEDTLEARLVQIRKTNWFSDSVFKKPGKFVSGDLTNWCKANCKQRWRTYENGLWYEFESELDRENFKVAFYD